MSSRISKDEALEKGDRIGGKKKNKKKNSPPVPDLLQAQQAPALLYAKVEGRPNVCVCFSGNTKSDRVILKTLRSFGLLNAEEIAKDILS